MNWEGIAATGEWAGAVAVVVTLVYLARQIRQQNQLARYNAWASITEGFTEVNRLLATDDEIDRIHALSQTDPDGMSDVDARKFQQFYMMYFNYMNRAYKAWGHGYLTAVEWRDMATQFHHDTSTPGGRLFRASVEHMFTDFWQEIDRHRTEAAGMDHSLARRSPVQSETSGQR